MFKPQPYATDPRVRKYIVPMRVVRTTARFPQQEALLEPRPGPDLSGKAGLLARLQIDQHHRPNVPACSWISAANSTAAPGLFLVRIAENRQSCEPEGALW